MEIALERPVEEQIADRQEAHALMVRHPRTNYRAAVARIIDCLVEAVAARPAVLLHLLEIFQRGGRIDARGQEKGVRRDDRRIRTGDFESQLRDAESAITFA